MFTGIIEEKGTVVELSAGKLTISADEVLDGTRVGDSISVAGVCLTVVELGNRTFTVDVSPETLRSSSLGLVKPGTPVNLERAMSAGGRFGGHMVNGHVDGVGTVRSVRGEANAWMFEISAPTDLARYLVPKGSVAVDGISLTVAEISGDAFAVSVIPHTFQETTLSDARPGTPVNIEVDIVAKYVEAFLTNGKTGGGIEQALDRGGFTTPDGDV